MALVEDLKAEFDALEADVAANTTVIGSAVTAFGGFATQLATLNQQIADLQAQIAAAGDPALTAAAEEVLARGKALQGQIEASTATLAAAVPANT